MMMFYRILVLVVLIALGEGFSAAASQPNILWISCEDISENLGCYGDPHATTPNLDRLASQGVRFDHAFTNAGVCAVVRSSLIMGMYAPSIGAQHMRSNIVPDAQLKAFPELMRAAGYFTTNRDKTDFQFPSTPSIWDRQGSKHQDWREREDPDQPFFCVINFTQCHESQIRHGEEEHAKVIRNIGAENEHDPDTCADTIPAYLPKTAATKKNWAWYHDNITYVDQLAGEVLDRLEEDGLADDTIVVFWSDHGMGMPRGKRWLYDTGTRVPVIVRWPEQIDAGSVRQDLVSTVDFAPTMLQLAGVSVPQSMQGRVFLGDQTADEPPYLFFHRDRMDEVYELQRAARDRRWKYIRNFEPEKPYSQRLDYMDAMPAMQDWRRLHSEGKLEGGQANWFVETKPIEELYDTEKDPYELNNLASKKQYTDRLARMRQATESWQVEITDTGMIPEAVLMEEMKPEGLALETQAPMIRRSGGSVVISCSTEGSSVVYKIRTDKGWGHWKLYTKSFDTKRSVQAIACRLGFVDSETVTSQSP